MRYGLIGCGGIGQLRADAISRVPGSTLVAVSDLEQQRAKDLATRQESIVYPRWQDMLDRDDLDAIIVSTPPSLHAEMSIAALSAGKHVLCEKPLARNTVEAQAMIAAANSAERFLATGFNYRFYPSITQAKSWLEAGLIGTLDHIRSYAGYTAADHTQKWLHDANVMGGGALRDNGIHLIDLTAYFLGGVAETKGLASGNVWKFPGLEDNGFVLLRNLNGNIATLQASWTEWQGYRFQIELYGTRGCILASCFPMKASLLSFDQIGGRSARKSERYFRTFVMEHLRSYRWVVVQSFIKELQEFKAAIGGNQSCIASGNDGLLALEVAETGAGNYS